MSDEIKETITEISSWMEHSMVIDKFLRKLITKEYVLSHIRDIEETTVDLLFDKINTDYFDGFMASFSVNTMKSIDVLLRQYLEILFKQPHYWKGKKDE